MLKSGWSNWTQIAKNQALNKVMLHGKTVNDSILHDPPASVNCPNYSFQN